MNSIGNIPSNHQGLVQCTLHNYYYKVHNINYPRLYRNLYHNYQRTLLRILKIIWGFHKLNSQLLTHQDYMLSMKYGIFHRFKYLHSDNILWEDKISSNLEIKSIKILDLSAKNKIIHKNVKIKSILWHIQCNYHNLNNNILSNKDDKLRNSKFYYLKLNCQIIY